VGGDKDVAGAVIGTGIGLGIHYLLNRESDRNLGDMITIPIFSQRPALQPHAIGACLICNAVLEERWDLLAWYADSPHCPPS
jgi:hypothetical protein